MSLLNATPSAQPAPVLIIGVGNSARGDDAIGPLLLARLRAELGDGIDTGVELLDAYQLQPEHALDLQGRRRSIVVDAAAAGTSPFNHARVDPSPQPTISTHSLSPAALAGVYLRLFGQAPALELLAVRGEHYGLGQPLSQSAAANLDAAHRWLRQALGLTQGEPGL